MKQTVDLAIIGGGGSGLTAALRASELGVKKIMIIEKNGFTGGNSNFPTGVLCANSINQLERGIVYDADLAFSKVMDDLKWTANPAIVHKYLKNTGTFVDWIISMNLGEPVFEASSNQWLGSFSLCRADAKKQPRLGNLLCSAFTEECKKKGIEIYLNSEATAIEMKGGVISGVIWRNGSDCFSAECKTVLISAGGVTGSVEALHRYFPAIYSLDDYRSSYSLTSNVGDGIELARKAGAETGRGMSIFTIGPALHDDYVIGFSQKDPRCLWLNKSGMRFFNEEKANLASSALLAQPGKIIYVVYDSITKEKIKSELRENVVLKMRGESVDDLELRYINLNKRNGKAAVLKSISEVADYMQVSKDTLLGTINRYNDQCDAQLDADMQKDSRFLCKVSQPPFYVSQSAHFYDSSQGGITINERMEVMTSKGQRIPGLYASGDNASGFVSPYYYAPQGAGITWAFNSGYMAAESIASYILNTTKYDS